MSKATLLFISVLSLAVAIALPWELRFGLRSILLCSGPRPFIGTGMLLAVPLLLALALLANSLVGLRASRSGEIDHAVILLTSFSLIPGLALWNFLHSWRCLGDSGDYHPALTRDEEAAIPLIVDALGRPWFASAVLWGFAAIAVGLGMWTYLSNRERPAA